MNVENIMTRNPICCTPDSRLDEVARMMMTRNCGEIPVVDGENSRNVVGVLTDRDIVVRAVSQGKNPLALTAADVMTSPVVTVTPDTRIEECCRTLESKQIRRAPVIDGSEQVRRRDEFQIICDLRMPICD